MANLGFLLSILLLLSVGFSFTEVISWTDRGNLIASDIDAGTFIGYQNISKSGTTIAYMSNYDGNITVLYSDNSVRVYSINFTIITEFTTGVTNSRSIIRVSPTRYYISDASSQINEVDGVGITNRTKQDTTLNGGTNNVECFQLVNDSVNNEYVLCAGMNPSGTASQIRLVNITGGNGFNYTSGNAGYNNGEATLWANINVTGDSIRPRYVVESLAQAGRIDYRNINDTMNMTGLFQSKTIPTLQKSNWIAIGGYSNARWVNQSNSCYNIQGSQNNVYCIIPNATVGNTELNGVGNISQHYFQYIPLIFTGGSGVNTGIRFTSSESVPFCSSTDNPVNNVFCSISGLSCTTASASNVTQTVQQVLRPFEKIGETSFSEIYNRNVQDYITIGINNSLNASTSILFDNPRVFNGNRTRNDTISFGYLNGETDNPRITDVRAVERWSIASSLQNTDINTIEFNNTLTTITAWTTRACRFMNTNLAGNILTAQFVVTHPKNNTHAFLSNFSCFGDGSTGFGNSIITSPVGVGISIDLSSNKIVRNLRVTQFINHTHVNTGFFGIGGYSINVNDGAVYQSRLNLTYEQVSLSPASCIAGSLPVGNHNYTCIAPSGFLFENNNVTLSNSINIGVFGQNVTIPIRLVKTDAIGIRVFLSNNGSTLVGAKCSSSFGDTFSDTNGLCQFNNVNRNSQLAILINPNIAGKNPVNVTFTCGDSYGFFNGVKVGDNATNFCGAFNGFYQYNFDIATAVSVKQDFIVIDSTSGKGVGGTVITVDGTKSCTTIGGTGIEGATGVTAGRGTCSIVYDIKDSAIHTFVASKRPYYIDENGTFLLGDFFVISIDRNQTYALANPNTDFEGVSSTFVSDAMKTGINNPTGLITFGVGLLSYIFTPVNIVLLILGGLASVGGLVFLAWLMVFLIFFGLLPLPIQIITVAGAIFWVSKNGIDQIVPRVSVIFKKGNPQEIIKEVD